MSELSYSCISNLQRQEIKVQIKHHLSPQPLSSCVDEWSRHIAVTWFRFAIKMNLYCIFSCSLARQCQHGSVIASLTASRRSVPPEVPTFNRYSRRSHHVLRMSIFVLFYTATSGRLQR